MSVAKLAVVCCLAALLAESLLQAADDQPASKPPLGPVLIGTEHFRLAQFHSGVFFSDGGKTIVAVGERLGVQWWDSETGKKLHDLRLDGRGHQAGLAADADLLVVSGVQQRPGDTARPEPVLWFIDAAGRKLLRTLKLPDDFGGNRQKPRVSADGKRIFMESEGGVRILDAKNGDELIRHKGSRDAGTLAVSRDGKLLAFGGYDIFLWRWETGEEPKKLTTVSNFGTELMEFSPDGKTLYIVPFDEAITTWDVATGRQTGSRPIRTMTQNLAFSPDGKTVAIATHSGIRVPDGAHTVDLLDTATWTELGRLPAGRIGVGRLSWSKDGTRLAGTSSQRAWVWNVKSRKVIGPTEPGHEEAISAMVFGPDGTLFTASDDHTIRSWDAATGAARLELVHDSWVRDLDVSPDGSLVAGSALDNDLRVWDAKTGKQRFKLLGNGTLGGRRRVRFTADGKHLIAWGDDTFVRFWDVRNGKLLSEHSTLPDAQVGDREDQIEARLMKRAFATLDISADGTALALGEGKGIRIIDPMSWKDRQTLNVGENPPGRLTFSPDAKRIVVAHQNKRLGTKLADGRTQSTTDHNYTLELWELASRKSVWTVTVEGYGPRCAYTPDGSRLAVLSHVLRGPSRLRVFDAASGKQVGQIKPPIGALQLAFDSAGKRLAVSFDDTTALVYDLETALQAEK